MLPKDRIDNNRHAKKQRDKARAVIAAEKVDVEQKGGDKGGQFGAINWKFYYCLIFIEIISLKDNIRFALRKQ